MSHFATVTTQIKDIAALTAGVLWGTMYIPYRKAYLTGMSPMSFITFFTIGSGNTLPTLVWGMIRTGLTPAVNAIGTLILLLPFARSGEGSASLPTAIFT